MDGSSPKKIAQGYVVIHGHFYQPPRENPWIEQIEVETSAHPFHDWNARISAECYNPNGSARIFDAQSRILDIVNNYEHISFNFGPTLISWLEAKAPLTYQRILEADRKSLAGFGHGNALAQAYNHAILPLSSPRDRETEVIWGLRDFEHRFGRPAEAMWLPETAVNYPTLANLVDKNLKFVILSPYQALRVRPLKGGPWQSVQGQTLDTTQPYRCFLPGAADPAKRRYIDVFFYNGQVAADISFGDLLQDSYRLSGRLVEGFNPDLPRPQILHVATDGENYGHHKRFGELALAHALMQVLPQRGFTLTNYAAFLESVPPQMEVELYLGPKGEGSSWSCAHGVARWKENCGDSTGGKPTWNQRWRTPLRRAFDFLNDKLAEIFEAEGQKYFRDPWGARNAYIEVILDRSAESLSQFFSREGVADLSQGQRVPALQLLEMQRHALLMYTSCGWFFADLSGLETIQVMKYAARALQLGSHFSKEPLEPPFLQILDRAVSNIPEAGTGRDLYLNRVQPAVVDFPRVANQWAISWLKNLERQCPTNIYHWSVEPLEVETQSHGSLVLGAGRLRLTSGITSQNRTLGFFTLLLGAYLYRTQVLPQPSPQDFQSLKNDLFQVLETTPEDLTPYMARRLGERYYTINDMFLEEKQEVFLDLLEQVMKEEESMIAHHFEETRPLLKAMAGSGLILPRLDRLVAEITLSRRLTALLEDLEREPAAQTIRGLVLELVKEAESLKLELDPEDAAPILTRLLERHLEELVARFDEGAARHLIDFLKVVNRIPVTLDLSEVQNSLFTLLKQRFPEVAGRIAMDPKAQTLARLLLDLLEALNFNPTQFTKLLA
jgi:alpha-amylase/alpha-mannosidase (GH57 family)